MPTPSLPEVIDSAATAHAPRFMPRQQVRFGGIDPLGLRQINFDLMDQVFPGVNNVARHVRPFSVVAWAWHHAAILAAEQGQNQVDVSVLQDFVDRIEVLFVWSQFLRKRNAELPGRDVFSPLLQASEYRFYGPEWEGRRETRRYSTALSAPITYGPALKSLRWILPHPKVPGAMAANPEAAPALRELDLLLSDHLGHPVFHDLEGEVTVTRNEAESWAACWDIDSTTSAERTFMANALRGPSAPRERRAGIRLVLAICSQLPEITAPTVRRSMCAGKAAGLIPSEQNETAVIWKHVQVRQLFRLALEALFYWVRRTLVDGDCSTQEMVGKFLSNCDAGLGEMLVADWLAAPPKHAYILDVTEAIQRALWDPAQARVEASLMEGIAASLREGNSELDKGQREDRLPITSALRDATLWESRSVREFLQLIFEKWVLAQHVYWSVGRGLADARASGKSILRLKVVLEDNGWSLTPGAIPGSAPVLAGDRLETIVSLLRECALIPNRPA